MLTTRVYNSLIEITPENCPESAQLTKISILKNEPFSFQIAYKLADSSDDFLPIHIKIVSELKVNYYYASCVPVLHTNIPDLKYKPKIGLYQDMLLPKKTNPDLHRIKSSYNSRYVEKGDKFILSAFDDSWQTLWFCINEDGVTSKSGDYDLKIEFYNSLDGELITSNNISVEVIDNKLPEQKLYYTNWFHYDCLVDYYREELFSDRYFEILSDYLKKASRNGMNMLLLPAFTPPLDTPVNGERMTVQLVKVKYENKKYYFDFSLMKKFIDICKKAGIKYFEHSHLFTQWGAKAAPKIMAMVNGKEKQLFGWNTDAMSAKYKKFLRAYLTAVREFFSQEKLVGNVLFHISDEPDQKVKENYLSALNTVEDLFEGYMHSDALWDYSFFEEGIVKSPIVSTGAINKFIGKCDNLWAYYTGGELREDLSNRILLTTRSRNRVLGIQLYYYKIKGFLHWGYNYYYGILSGGFFDPKINPCGYGSKVGTSYCVYPANDGTALQSIRQKVFGEGICDFRGLQLLEKLAGRKVCKELIEKHFGIPDFEKTAVTPEIFIQFREELYSKIAEYNS